MHRRAREMEREHEGFEELREERGDESDDIRVDIEHWFEDDEISDGEEGFMRGYLSDEEDKGS